MCNFRVGQKVECIRNPVMAYAEVKYPAIGSVWRIRDIVPCPNSKRQGIRLVGWHLPTHPGIGLEFILYTECFRPVVERKTDIEIFRRMLNTTTEKVEY